MDRHAMTSVAKVIGEAAGICVLAAIVIGIMGYVSKWTSPLVYSNAFFIAGGLAIIAGASSRVAAGADWGTYQRFHAESLHGQSIGEQIGSIVTASSPWRLVILGFVSGVTLMLISVIVSKAG